MCAPRTRSSEGAEILGGTCLAPRVGARLPDVGWCKALTALDEAVFALFNVCWERGLETVAALGGVRVSAARDRVDPGWMPASSDWAA